MLLLMLSKTIGRYIANKTYCEGLEKTFLKVLKNMWNKTRLVYFFISKEKKANNLNFWRLKIDLRVSQLQYLFFDGMQTTGDAMFAYWSPVCTFILNIASTSPDIMAAVSLGWWMPYLSCVMLLFLEDNVATTVCPRSFIVVDKWVMKECWSV